MSAADGASGAELEPVIGLEVHVQLRTATKLFSSAPSAYGAEPNTCTNEVDLGMPGALPVLNARAVELALRVALALDCELRPLSRFERKHYFYPDIPKGYQITQYLEPYANGGRVPLELDGEPREVPLTRIHLEEDAGKSIHDDAITGPGVSHVDLNRAGVPLIEIVSEPALRSAREAGAYLRSLRSIVRAVGASDADMEKGQFRCDANVSVRPRGQAKLGAKVELKNLNSFRAVEHAIGYEIARQRELVGEGGRVAQETRHWDERSQSSRASRRKEDADDYRYFPDPDLLPLRLDPVQIAAIASSLPELPPRRRARYREQLGLPADDAQLLADDPELAAFFEAVLACGPSARLAATWIQRGLLELRAERGVAFGALQLAPERFAALLALLESGRVTAASARPLLAALLQSDREPEALARELGLESLSDRGELEALAREVLAAHPEPVAQYRAGDTKLLHFLIGQVMRRTRGKADPAALRELLTRLLA